MTPWVAIKFVRPGIRVQPVIFKIPIGFSVKLIRSGFQQNDCRGPIGVSIRNRTVGSDYAHLRNGFWSGVVTDQIILGLVNLCAFQIVGVRLKPVAIRGNNAALIGIAEGSVGTRHACGRSNYRTWHKFHDLRKVTAIVKGYSRSHLP